MGISFLSAGAEQLWAAYFLQLRKQLRHVPKAAADDLVDEIEAHARAILSEIGEPTEANIATVLARLGAPECYIGPILADRLLGPVSSTCRSVGVARTVLQFTRRNIARATAAIVLGPGYILAFALLLTALLKPFFPDVVGLFYGSDGKIVLGGLTDSSDYRELLGFWLIPIGLVCGSALYFLSDKLLSRWLELMTR